MKRLQKTAVIFILAACMSACGVEYPKEIWIDNDFSKSEEFVMRLAIGRWEEQTGLDLFTYRGRIDAGEFRREDLGDGAFVIYKIQSLDEGDAREVWEFKDPGYNQDEGHSGWATTGDMLIFVPDFDEGEGEKSYLHDLFGVFLHEFGHTLLLGHIKDERAVMSLGNGFIGCLTELDLEAFCSMNGCEEGYVPALSERLCLARHGDGIY